MQENFLIRCKVTDGEKIHYFVAKVPIKEELKKSLIFGLESRLPIGIILGFVGYRHTVIALMQTISHGTRAFIINANALPGFIV